MAFQSPVIKRIVEMEIGKVALLEKTPEDKQAKPPVSSAAHGLCNTLICNEYTNDYLHSDCIVRPESFLLFHFLSSFLEGAVTVFTGISTTIEARKT